MVPMPSMLEYKNLSLSDAEAAGFDELSQAAKRCQRCMETTACIRWLKWRGAYGSPPACLNAGYFDWLKQQTKPRTEPRIAW